MESNRLSLEVFAFGEALKEGLEGERALQVRIRSLQWWVAWWRKEEATTTLLF